MRAGIELDRSALCKNVESLSALLPPDCQLMPAVKANAYGHGAALIAPELERLGIRAFCVATVEEGVELRQYGIAGNVLILGYTPPDRSHLLHEYDLIQTVVDASYAALLDASGGKRFRVHLKIDTGMRRLGERCEQVERIAGIFRRRSLVIEGIYTHLCTADMDTPRDAAFTQAQGASFRETVAELERRGCSCGKPHLLASSGLLHYPELGGAYARVGIAPYGLLSRRDEAVRCPVPLHPVLSLKARIVLTKELYAGESVGYGLQYTAERDRRIAVLSIGYADGLPRVLSNGRGAVLIRGRRAPVIGHVCMDQTIVDVTDIPDANAGDTAVVLGRSGAETIDAYDIAEQTGTITNEVLSRLGSRPERILL